MKRALRLIGRIVLVIVGLLAVLVLYLRLFSGDVLKYAVSPDQRNIAEWREYQTHSATTPNTDAVQLRTRFNPFRHTALTGEFAVHPSVVWIDSHNLRVDCDVCGNFDVDCDSCQLFHVDFKETRWHDVTIHYGKD